jgi:hypothetical protein
MFNMSQDYQSEVPYQGKKHPSLCTLPPSELEKVAVLTEEQIIESLEKGWKEFIQAWDNYAPPGMTGQRFS